MDKKWKQIKKENKKRHKRNNKIKRALKLENTIFEKLHVISLIIIFILAVIIAIEYYLLNIKNANKGNWLDDIEISENDDTDTTTSKTYNSEEVLLNPGKGLVLRDSLDSSCDSLMSVVYYRFGWSIIEPEEGQYNWSVIDSKINNCIKRGKKFAFGIMNSCSASPREYITPKWVFDAGAEYTTFENSYGIIQKNPVWTDEVYLEKLNNFINVLAERYDGNENIAFIDIRSYGNYGEQHLTSIGGTVITAEQLKNLYIKPYMNAFKSTLLVSPWGKDMYDDTYKWAIDNGVSIRRDGILALVNGKSCFDYAYGKLPTIFEYYADYSNLKKQGLWDTEKLLEYVETWHPSYIEFFTDMYKENKEFCEMIANKIGYYFKFRGATYTNKITTLEENNITLNFINEGVAPLYEPCTFYIGLLDENYNLVKKYKTDIDPHTWMPNEDIQENINIQLDGIKTGKYIISLGLFLNEDDENPTYLLGNSGGTDDKWYVFGKIEITEPAEEYNILIENEGFLVNSYSGYNFNVNATNLKKDSIYEIKLYVNNNLIRTIPIDSSNLTYNDDFAIEFENGNNAYDIKIEKDNEIVHEIHKEIYVSNFTENYSEISNEIISKYSEFKTKFSKELSQVSNLSNKIKQMEDYIASVKATTKILQSASINAMKMHYELGDLILQEYKLGDLQVDDNKISEMLDMLNSIGNYYEDLVTISAQDLNDTDIMQLKAIIQETDNFIIKPQ